MLEDTTVFKSRKPRNPIIADVPGIEYLDALVGKRVPIESFDFRSPVTGASGIGISGTLNFQGFAQPINLELNDWKFERSVGKDGLPLKTVVVQDGKNLELPCLHAEKILNEAYDAGGQGFELALVHDYSKSTLGWVLYLNGNPVARRADSRWTMGYEAVYQLVTNFLQFASTPQSKAANPA